MRGYEAYPAYRDSGVAWLGKVPSSWPVNKLKFFASIFPSNVDKKTVSGEPTVKLCNYTDVYYNDEIDSTISFMKATASREQVEKFALLNGDTLITKDSEDPADIAVPAYVTETLPEVVCGYHLSVVRPYRIEIGKYLNYLFKAAFARAYFQTRANGLTRYGIGSYALLNVKCPQPKIVEAIAIAKFLDHETAKIDTLIEKQQQLIKLLKEKRQAVISHAVTKGLNPDVPMKDSGVEWLGEVPAHWEVKKVGRACIVQNNLRTPIERQLRLEIEGDYSYYGPTGVLNRINKYVVEGEYFLIGEDGDHFLKYKTNSMTIYVNEKFSVNNHAHLIRGGAGCSTKWACLFFEHQDLSPWLIKQGVARYKLRKESLLTIPMVIPPLKEQKLIISELTKRKQEFTNLVEKVQITILLLSERRTTLISAAVTGKIDVRNWQPPESTLTPSTDA